MSGLRFDADAVPLEGVVLAEASAGTGKTYTITRLYERLLEKGLMPSEILVVTYTRAATAELKLRIRSRLRERFEQEVDLGRKELFQSALRAFDEASIATIHGFCQRALELVGFESGLSPRAEVIPDQSLLVEEVAIDFFANHLYEHAALADLVVRAKKLTVAHFIRLAHKAVSFPDVPVLPELTDELAAALDALESGDYQRARDEALALWEQDEEILFGLLNGPALNKASYKEASVAAWRLELGPALRGGPGGLPTEWFAKIGTAALAAKTKKGHEPPSHRFFDLAEEMWEIRERLSKTVLTLLVEFVHHARRELARRKEEAGLLSYDDLLHRLRDALEGESGDRVVEVLAGRYRAALIDEFQDTDPVQYEIFKRVFQREGHGLFLIGDPKQAIYAFRGADLHAYLGASADAEDHRYTLGTNWRSDPAMVRASNAVFGNRPMPFLMEDIAFTPVDASPSARIRLRDGRGRSPGLRLLYVDDPEPLQPKNGNLGCHSATYRDGPLVKRVASEVVRMLTDGTTRDHGSATGEPMWQPLVPGDIAVLCRTNSQCRRVQQELRLRGIPTVLDGDESLLETEEAEEVERVAVAMADPTQRGAVRAALATTLLGGRGEDFAEFAADDRAWDEALEKFHRCARLWRDEGFYPAFRRVLADHDAPARLLRRRDGERRLTNVLHMAELLHHAALAESRGPLALISWLSRMRADQHLRHGIDPELGQVRLESDAKAVRLTTIHRSKGLEFPVVVMPFPWHMPLAPRQESEFVLFHDGEGYKLDVGTDERDEHSEQAKEEALAENLRLAYVALTRAKHRVDFVWGPFGGIEEAAFAYLLHPPEEGASIDTVVALKDRIKGTSLERLRDDLVTLARRSDGAIVVESLPPATDATLPTPTAHEVVLRERAAHRRFPKTYRTSSFTALLRGAEALSEWALEGRDVDELSDDVVVPKAQEGERIRLERFPAGARPGILIHSVFEELDFQAPLERRRTLVEGILARYGESKDLADDLTAALDEVLTAPLPPCGVGFASFTLGEVTAANRLNEMDFLLPVAEEGGAFTAELLARAFEEHDGSKATPHYAERLRRLGFQLEGFLRGIVDLVFRHEDRWFVLDYKSNHLGPHPGDYDSAALGEAMVEHDYVLQAHLYALAVHRFLTSRDPDYSYESHFGGIYYLFVRGMSPRWPGAGVFCDRPSLALITALDRALKGARGSRPGPGEVTS